MKIDRTNTKCTLVAGVHLNFHGSESTFDQVSIPSAAINYRQKLKMAAAAVDSVLRVCGHLSVCAALRCLSIHFSDPLRCAAHDTRKISNVHKHNVRHTTKEKSSLMCVLRACSSSKADKSPLVRWTFQTTPLASEWAMKIFSTAVYIHVTCVIRSNIEISDTHTAHVHIPSLHGHYSGIIVINVVRREHGIGNMCARRWMTEVTAPSAF